MESSNRSVFLGALLCLSLLGGCMSDAQLEKKVAKILKENPEVLTEVIEDNPAEVMEAFQKAAKSAEKILAKKREEEERKKLEEHFEKPLNPKIRKDEAIRGNKDAPLVLVEYADFECSFCSKSLHTVLKLTKKYGDKIQFIYKHLPLGFHPQAMISAQYYEAIRLQDSQKAFKFHDKVYKDQSELRNGEKFLKVLAKTVGADMKRLKKDLHSQVVKDRIAEDRQEAAKFGMQGTPGFLLNGVPVKGAYPVEHFVNLVNELKKRGKVKL